MPIDGGSPDPGHAERLAKLLDEFLTISSIRRYVVVEQGRVTLTVFERDDLGTVWRRTDLGIGRMLNLPVFNVSLPLADIYRRVALPSGFIASERAA